MDVIRLLSCACLGLSLVIGCGVSCRIAGADSSATTSPSPSAGAGQKTGTVLGALGFKPTPEHPFGWRGDGTGSFPGATPPLEWYRRPRGAYNSIRVSAAKPKGAGPEGQPLNMGMIREWLVAGPFEAKDHATALNDVAQPDESSLHPAAGQQLGGKTWQAVPVSVLTQSLGYDHLALDLAVLFDKKDKQEWQNHAGSLEPLVAYACSYLYAAEAVQVRLGIVGQKTAAWLNGTPLPGTGGAPPAVELKAGWNELLVKAASSKGQWNMTAVLYPTAASGYETKNIVWMAPMPGPSWSSPIVVGAKIFINADAGTLVCLNKEDGRILWTRSTTFFHAITEQERSKFPEIAAKAHELDQLMQELPNELNAALSVDGSRADGNTGLQTRVRAKIELERGIQAAMAKADRKTYECWDNDRGTTTPTPVSDGKSVYVAMYGGNKGIGANVVACYDLEGKCLWSQFTGQTGIGEHGTHSTPVLSGNLLVYLSGLTLFGFDKATGRIVWQKRVPGSGCARSSMIALKVAGVDAVLAPEQGLYRSADGAELWKTEVNSNSTPVLVNGMVYGIAEEKFYYALGIGDRQAPVVVNKTPWKDLSLTLPGIYGNIIIGAPLYDKGMVYVVTEGGALTAVDAQTGKAAYSKALDSLNPRLTWVFVVGICTGPNLAGKYIHIRDDQSQTLVIAPGPVYKELAKNVLWEMQADGKQQEAQSNPFYEGGRIYYRTQGFLYCIGEK